ncbi:hypothetical protein H7X69_00690 [Candidatus Saccharibacteria bacterium]|nr:hypothetical protein [Candidatus Saccharibacteria bacterium]
MGNEELPSLSKDVEGNDVPAFWAGDKDSKEAALESKDVSPDVPLGIDQLGREELGVLATQLAVPSGSKISSKPQKEGSDTYLG